MNAPAHMNHQQRRVVDAARCTSRRVLPAVRLLLLLLLPAIARGQQANGMITLAPRAQRLSDDVIARDLRELGALATAAQQAGDQRRAALVDLARDAYERNDDGALSALMLSAAANRSSIPRTTRADLWSVLDSVRATAPADDSVRTELALLESALIRAQYPLLGAPSCARWERDAERLAAALRARRPVPVVAVVPPAPVVTPPPVRDTVIAPPAPVRIDSLEPAELRGVPSMVHFALDKHVLSPASRNVLAALVDSLRYFPTVSIVLEGHTDLRASVEYNLALSRRRTESVRAYLELLGLDSARIRIVAQGKSQLEAAGTDRLSHARNRRVQLRYFAANGAELPATRLLDDLQLEATPVPRARPRRP